MNLLYNIGIGAMRAGIRVGAMRSGKLRAMLDGQKLSTEHVLSVLGDGGCDVWVHAASLGEFEQGRPLIEKIRREHPDWRIALTFFSPSGYEVRKDYKEVDVVAYLPLDSPKAMTRFLDALKPRMAVIVKYEFWSNMLQWLKDHDVPTYLICGIFRRSQSFFKPWGGMMRGALRCFTHLFVQDENSQTLLADIGITNATVAGDTRLDRVTDIVSNPVTIAGLDKFGDGRVRMVFGSSWEADEDVYLPWLGTRSDLAPIIAPHEFDAERLEALRRELGDNTLLLSEWEKAVNTDADFDVNSVKAIVVDSFGKLSTIYRVADMAYVGGGFGAGIHNVPEAAVYGIPVIIGPKYGKFKEAVDLVNCEGAFSIDSADTFASIASRLADDTDFRTRAGNASKHYIEANTGATNRIYNAIEGLKANGTHTTNNNKN